MSHKLQTITIGQRKGSDSGWRCELVSIISKWQIAKAFLFFCLMCLGSSVLLAQHSEGQKIFADRCARCHGTNGEGVPDLHDKPLWGDRSIVDLSDYIAKTMPKDAIGDCVGGDAQVVAEFLHDSFYTEMARARNRPPHIELARLTVRQYSESIADLVGIFRGGVKWQTERGLDAQYRDKDNKSPRPGITRVDPTIDFHFGPDSPDGENLANEYRITWRGGLLSEQTGDYEFCVESTNGVRLYVNDMDRMFIDAWVKSGNSSEFTGTIRLLAGRVYPIRLELQKSAREECNVALKWKPPRKARQLIAAKNLSPGTFPKVMVVESSFPADDSSYGYERGTAVSRAWKEATARAAMEVADKIAKEISKFVPGKEEDADRNTKLEAFCVRLVERAYRHPLTDEDRQIEINSVLAGEAPESEKILKLVARTLVSPRFLYPVLQQTVSDDFTVASKLALVLWDSVPDESLWRAAQENRLHTEKQIRSEAHRMAKDVRAKNKLRYFFEHYLLLERAAEVSKDAELYPGFDRDVLSDMRTSLELFLDDILESDSADFRRLFTAREMYVNNRLANFYKLELADEDGFRKIAFDPAERSGILTHPYLMTAFAYHKSSSPIHRGVFLARNVLGRTLRAPPIAVAPLDEAIDIQLTTRERVLMQTKSDACQSCHAMINPLGFTLENFDAVGRFRSIEKEKTIDTTGNYRATTGEEIEFRGPRELAEFLVAHRDSRQSFVVQLFHHTVQQSIFAYGPDQVDRLSERFALNQFNIRSLFEEIAITAAGK